MDEILKQLEAENNKISNPKIENFSSFKTCLISKMNPATTAAKSSKIQELINQIKAMKRGEATNYPAIQDLQNAATETIQIKRFKLLRARYKENGNPQPEKPSNGEGFTPQ